MSRLSVPRLAFPLICAAFVVSVVAGCIGDEASNPDFVATGSGGVLFRGWDYEGTTRQAGDAQLRIDVNEVTNNGTVRANGTFDNRSYLVELTEFSHNADDFHSGGVAANFDEHGDSGVGNTLLPRMHLLLATWGPGQLIIDGNATVDPYTGSDVWDAHLMVTSTGVREDGKVMKADGSGPYDPADPGNARIGSDMEAHLVLSSTYANDTLAPITETFEESVTAPQGTVQMPFEVPIAVGDIKIEIDLGDSPQPGRYDFTLLDPEGNPSRLLLMNTLVPTNPTNGTINGRVDMAGTWTLVARTEATPVSFTADVQVTFPPKPIYYLFWENVDVEERVVS